MRPFSECHGPLCVETLPTPSFSCSSAWPASVDDAVCYLQRGISAGDFRNDDLGSVTASLKEASRIVLYAVREADEAWTRFACGVLVHADTESLLDSLQRQDDMDAWWVQPLSATLTVERGIVRGSMALICPQLDELDGREMTLEGRMKTIMAGLVGRTTNLDCAAIRIVGKSRSELPECNSASTTRCTTDSGSMSDVAAASAPASRHGDRALSDMSRSLRERVGSVRISTSTPKQIRKQLQALIYYRLISASVPLRIVNVHVFVPRYLHLLRTTMDSSKSLAHVKRRSTKAAMRAMSEAFARIMKRRSGGVRPDGGPRSPADAAEALHLPIQGVKELCELRALLQRETTL